MKLTHINVRNYKGLRETECKLSDFVCAVGENNAGKSTLLQALLLFLNGTKLSKTDYYDPIADIVITVTVHGLSADVLARLTDEHRAKISPYIDAETIVLARRYSTDGSSKLRVITRVPIDPKYGDEQLDLIFKGKKGREIAEVLLAVYPEVAPREVAFAATTQKAAKDLIQHYILALPADQTTLSDIPLPTGIDNSIRSVLPEPVYIPAVKDLMDDLKTKESASFGKLLNILLDVIEGDLTDTAETFEALRKKLNRITGEDGVVTDDRMERVKAIEKTIQDNLQETFRNVRVELEIPPPEIKTVLSNATIIADDGVRGPADLKGDGFKRAITFSILRTYVQLSQDVAWRSEPEEGRPTREKFLFLFEEPELYLHPRAQNILFDALTLIARNHQVVVTTHSPMFLSASGTKTFIKVAKRTAPEAPKPFGECYPVDLTDIAERDAFQLISFESSNVAFFSSKIVLVEGDSELIALPHISAILDPKWDFKSTSTNVIKVSGKGAFKRYREFFKRFGVKVYIVADLDVLVEDFDKLDASERATELRRDLLRLVDAIIDAENRLEQPSPRLLREELQRDRARVLYEQLGVARRANDVPSQTRILDELFVFERSKPRLVLLADNARVDVLALKRQLLSELRSTGVCVLERGAIEAYYSAGVVGDDKPTKAQSFCLSVTTQDQVRALSDQIESGGEQVSELEAIMRTIFDG
ncbi:MAG TPA: AAA family ATPase [Kiritimatiellia bacterium]|nr:AAA family ATPase [Kiritimatiellia bacterium]HMP35244.1 AAA family ATPase [Kiritimatiellia bacterium]